MTRPFFKRAASRYASRIACACSRGTTLGPPAILEMACTRYKALGIWGRDPILPRAVYDRLLSSLVSGGFVAPGTPFSVAVDNGVAAAVVAGTHGLRTWRTFKGVAGALTGALEDFVGRAEATADGFVGTDEASVVERAGLPVAVVAGSQVNMKITQPGDLDVLLEEIQRHASHLEFPSMLVCEYIAFWSRAAVLP